MSNFSYNFLCNCFFVIIRIVFLFNGNTKIILLNQGGFYMDIILYICFLFIIYSFLGWIIEQLYSLFKLHTFQSDSFLTIPLKPMYGIAMTLLIIFFEQFNINNIYILLFLCFIIPSLIEYISGYLLYHLLKKSYWDYSSFKYNFNGYVCLRFSLYWTLLSWIGITYVNPIIKNYYLLNSYIINISTVILLFIFFSDFALVLKRKHFL